MARRHGIHGFCFYYYWFNGRRLLEKPLDRLLAQGRPDFPFCICWANENWTRAWDGLDDEVLVAQKHGEDDDRRFILDLIRRRPRYGDASAAKRASAKSIFAASGASITTIHDATDSIQRCSFLR